MFWTPVPANVYFWPLRDFFTFTQPLPTLHTLHSLPSQLPLCCLPGMLLTPVCCNNTTFGSSQLPQKIAFVSWSHQWFCSTEWMGVCVTNLSLHPPAPSITVWLFLGRLISSEKKKINKRSLTKFKCLWNLKVKYMYLLLLCSMP